MITPTRDQTPNSDVPQRRVWASALSGALAALLLASAGPSLAESSPLESAELEISVINGTYAQINPGLAPIQQGPVTLLVQSPENELTVHGNKLTLDQRADGLIDAAFEASLEGWGQLIVTMKTGAGDSTFEDRVTAGRQWLKTAGTLRLERAEGGYLATFIDFVYDEIGVQIESELAGQIVDACRAMVSLGFVVLDCDALQASMTRIKAPMPEPGSQFLIRAELLTPEERQVFDRFVVSD